MQIHSHLAVAQYLRQAIVRGDFLPGSRLPERKALIGQFRCSGSTVQTAFDLLADEGFIIATRRKGSFVTDCPPNLCRFGLAFPVRRVDHPIRLEFYETVHTEMRRLAEKRGYSISAYYGLNFEMDIAERDRLYDDLSSYRLAGLFYLHPVAPEFFHGHSPWDIPGIPRVIFWENPLQVSLPQIALDETGFITRALDTVRSRGYQRLAVLDLGPRNDEPILHSGIAARNLIVPPYWHIHCHHEGISQITELLLQAPAAQRPQALLVLDNTMLDAVLAGIRSTGLRVPNDIDVICHWNFPLAYQDTIPVTRLGYDLRQLAQLALDTLERMREGKAPPDITFLPTVFDHEITSAVS